MYSRQLVVHCRGGSGPDLDTLYGMLIKVRLDCSQPARMFRITPFEIQPLENRPDAFFHPAGHERQIHLRVMSQHYLIIKHMYTAITDHETFPFFVIATAPGPASPFPDGDQIKTLSVV